MRNTPKTAMLLTMLATAWTYTSQTHADVIDDAYRMCGAFTQTGMVSDCEVKGGEQAVIVTMPMRAIDAIKACPQIANMTAQAGAHFTGEWRLRIFSPDSVRPIATCKLAVQ